MIFVNPIIKAIEAKYISKRSFKKRYKHAAFRVWFTRLHELRSLLDNVPFIALTATATKDTRASIFEALAMVKPHMIADTPIKTTFQTLYIIYKKIPPLHSVWELIVSGYTVQYTWAHRKM